MFPSSTARNREARPISANAATRQGEGLASMTTCMVTECHHEHLILGWAFSGMY